MSGTKVEAIFALKLKRPATGSSYTSAIVTAVEIKIGDEADSAVPFVVPTADRDNVLTPDPKTGECGYGVRVRFASTRFPDATRVNLNATFRYKLLSSAGDSPPLAATLRTVHVVTYNKGLAWHTRQYVWDTGYKTVYKPPPDAYNADAPLAMEPVGALDFLSGPGGMRHSMLYGMDTVLQGPAILAGLKRATAVFAYTHGNPDASFQTSWGDLDIADGSTDTRALNFGAGANSEVWQAVQRNRIDPATLKAIPPINLAVFHACSLAANGHRLARALGIYGPDEYTSANDRACAGFPEVVYSQLYDPITRKLSTSEHLSDHAKKLYGELALGRTFGEALTAANRRYPPAKLTNQRYREMDMALRGDPYMRLISVYTAGIPNVAPDASPNRPPNELGPGRYPYRWYLVIP